MRFGIELSYGASLFCTGERSEVLAETEGADALLKRSAMAAVETLQKRLEFEGTGDVLFDVDKFASRELFPAGADGNVVAETAEEELDFREGESHVAGEADKKEAMDGVRWVTTLAVEALRWGEETHFLIIADG